jgi:hypothetical protein
VIPLSVNDAPFWPMLPTLVEPEQLVQVAVAAPLANVPLSASYHLTVEEGVEATIFDSRSAMFP